MRSVVVVLPASICAMIPKLRSSSMACTRRMGCSLNSVVLPLPAIVREGAFGFRHPVHVFTLLNGVPPAIRCVEQLGREPLRHRLFVAIARRRDDPANPERLAAHRAN